MKWHNWAGDQACAPTGLHSASSVQHVVDVVGIAATHGHRIRVRGAGHSFSPAVLTNGLLVDIDALRGVLDVDRESERVRVQAGIRLHELNRRLHAHGLALPNLGDIDRQTLAGAIATATHGTGGRLRNISAQVTAAELVTADGRVVEIDQGDDLLAARVNLGALGIVTAATLQCEPSFVLHRTDDTVPLETVLGGFDQLVGDNDHFEFFAFPHSPLALTIRRNRTDDVPKPHGRVHRLVSEDLVGNRLANLLLRTMRARPELIRRFMRLAPRILGEGDYVDQSFRVFSSPREIRFTEMEYAVPRAQGPAAVRAVLDVIEEEGFAVPMPIECRVVAGDDALLSPTHEQDSVYIAVHQFQGMEWRPYFAAAEEIFLGFGGRPHWGKRHELTRAQAAERWPRFDDFLAVRDRLDPDGRFGNDWTDQVLGPSGR